MALDNILEIGARVVLDGLNSGMASARSVVTSSTDAMGAAFESLHTITFGAVDGMVGSLTDLGTSAKETADVIAEASLAGGEAISLMAERMVEAAETAKVSAAGIGSAFSGLSVLLGGGLVAGFFAHLIDETKDTVLEMSHLSEKSGIAIETIAGLKFVADATGSSMQIFEQALVRLIRAQELAVQGGKAQAQALADIGLKVSDVKNLSPEELFFKVAEALNSTESSAARATAAFALFGRGGTALLPILEQYRGNLREVVMEHAAQNEGLEKGRQSALQYQEAVAQISETLRTAMIPVLEFTVNVLHGAQYTLEQLKVSFQGFVITLANTAENLGTLMKGVAQSIAAAASGDYAGAIAASAAARDEIKANKAFALQYLDEIDVESEKKLADMRDRFADFGKTSPRITPDVPTDGGKKDKKDDSALKAAEERIKQKQKDFDDEFRMAQQFADETGKIEQAQTTEYVKLQAIKLDAEKKHQLARLDLEKQVIGQERALHQISAEQEAKLLTDLENRRYEIERNGLLERSKLEAELDNNDPVKMAERNAQIEALADKHEAALTAIHRKAVEERAKEDEKAAKEQEKRDQRMERSMVRFFDTTILNSKNFNDALNKGFRQIEGYFLNTLTRMLAKWLSHQVAKLAIHETTKASEIATTAAGAAATEGIEIPLAIRSILRSAAKAAAAQFQKVIEAVPFPANLAAAPVAAAAAYTEAAGFIASAEGGWDIPAGVNPLAQLHEKEMVLPAPLAEGVRAMAGQSDTVANLDRDIHVHFNASIQALDSQGFERVLQKHSQTLSRQLVRIFRNGNLKMDYALR